MRMLLLGAALLLATAAAPAQDEKILRSLSVEETEALLKKLDIDFTKVDAKLTGTTLYDFKRNNFSVRFHNFEGKDVMLDAVFPPLAIERVNDWNMKAKFSRATLQRDPKGAFTTLESNLDLAGGVTDSAVRQFVQTFDEEIRLFAKFSGQSSSDDQVFTPITAQKIEDLLRGLSLEFRKKESGETTAYEFEVDGRKFRLTNFAGKDVMMDTRYKRIAPEHVNRYNLEKKFVRAVGYDVKGDQFTALESNLDCEAGTTVGILRYFLLGFTEDARHFDRYAKDKSNTAAK